MPQKRKRISADAEDGREATIKKAYCSIDPQSRDFLSPLSDELLVRILALLSLPYLLNVAPVSKRFHRLSEDSLVWKRLYYSRFVLPRALRIPGFRDGSAREGKLHYSSRKAIWTDGRRGGWVDMRSDENDKSSRDWKRQYKLRHNWARGKCAVEELKIGHEMAFGEADTSRKMLVKVCDGIAVTADVVSGLRAWDLKTKHLVARINLSEGDAAPAPSCLAIDDCNLSDKALDIAVGFTDGSFGIWKLDISGHRMVRRYRHKKSTNGELVGAAFAYPLLLTATESVLISLYTFEGPVGKEYEEQNQGFKIETEMGSECETAREPDSHTEDEFGHWSKVSQTAKPRTGVILPAPYLLTSLKSHTSRAPLALSIRRPAGITIASIAYTFSTIHGWSLGIQDLHLRPSTSRHKRTPDISNTRLAYTLPVANTFSQTLSPPSSPARPSISRLTGSMDETPSNGPTNICYTHPYLLATLPDNTLILYLCTSNAASLSISPGIRLWGHTSGISDAEITARGKAVSVSCRGEEIRVWELEGRADGKSIEVRPNAPSGDDEQEADIIQSGFDDQRNWVGFDDEMVIVLKESQGRESLMVYDFT